MPRSRSLVARFNRNPNEPTSLGIRPVHLSTSAATTVRSRSSRSSCCRRDAYSAAALAYSSGGKPKGQLTRRDHRVKVEQGVAPVAV